MKPSERNVKTLLRNKDWEPAPRLSDKPGTVVLYNGPPPQFSKVSNWNCWVWHCEKCGNVVPAGVMPFPHQGCNPGTIVRVEFSWNQRLSRVKEAISEIARL